MRLSTYALPQAPAAVAAEDAEDADAAASSLAELEVRSRWTAVNY